MPTPASRPRLRAKGRDNAFHLVLVEPEIPPNTGNVARLCAATNSPLHLVGPLGFDISDHAVRRAGLDYWHLVSVQHHADWDTCNEALTRAAPTGRRWFFTTQATKSYLDVDFREGDALVFGKESVGLPESLLARYPDQLVGIPMLGAVRSLNLANTVSIALYEALRQIGALANAELE
ncbi:MAG: tRNA (cytidine(34)-2'-O)-methyltransferase [Polyangiaceae bacterium]|nr:tRNA (cytidine(34)-2'-O)-methyltransferase [Polyangiaceae bacterium]